MLFEQDYIIKMVLNDSLEKTAPRSVAVSSLQHTRAQPEGVVNLDTATLRGAVYQTLVMAECTV